MNPDIFLHILEWAPPDTLSSVCRASRDARNLATPLLYKSVNFTVDAELSSDESSNDNTDLVIQKQQRFLDTMAQRPEYRRLVRQFAWTAGLLRDSREDELREELPYVSPELHLFESLQSVKDVSIRSTIPWVEMNPDAANALASSECDALFPAASSVDIGGRMNDTLARTMLQRKRRDSLRSLRVDDHLEGNDSSDNDEC
ncbi:MAG: hypothetical protein Q9162_001067 [Coniocarpon cinnabarinum]